MALVKCESCGKEISDKAAVCPHCGNSATLLVESDRVKVARMQAEVAQTDIALRYREHRDRMGMDLYRFRGQIISICSLAAVILVLIGIYALR